MIRFTLIKGQKVFTHTHLYLACDCQITILVPSHEVIEKVLSHIWQSPRLTRASSVHNLMEALSIDTDYVVGFFQSRVETSATPIPATTIKEAHDMNVWECGAVPQEAFKCMAIIYFTHSAYLPIHDIAVAFVKQKDQCSFLGLSLGLLLNFFPLYIKRWHVIFVFINAYLTRLKPEPK